MREVNDWNSLATKFFLDYITEDSVYYTPSGNMTFSSMQECAQLLLNRGVFTSVKDMREQAIKDFGIVLPDTVFEGGPHETRTLHHQR